MGYVCCCSYLHAPCTHGAVDYLSVVSFGCQYQQGSLSRNSVVALYAPAFGHVGLGSSQLGSTTWCIHLGCARLPAAEVIKLLHQTATDVLTCRIAGQTACVHRSSQHPSHVQIGALRPNIAKSRRPLDTCYTCWFAICSSTYGRMYLAALSGVDTSV